MAHIELENAVPISGILVADVVTRANIQSAFVKMARDGEMAKMSVTLPLADLIATQQVVDRQRVAMHEERLRKGGKDYPPLVLLWCGDSFLLDGHHRVQACHNLGIEDIVAELMSAPE